MRTRLASGEKPNRKRMATLACVYDAEPSPRRPHDIIAPPGGRHGGRTLRPRPKATAKWLAGSVRHDPASMIAAAFSQAGARDRQHKRTWVVLVDGAEHQLDLIRAEAARRGVTIHIVIDLIHVLEYLWKAAWCLHRAGDPAAEDWVAVKALAVLAGDSARAAAEITAEAETASLTATQRTGADACVRYLTGKDDYLRYDQALAAGWPIATGVIEGACRHLIGDRLDITGARWGLQGAEAVLTLRAVTSNGDFDDYWRFHLAREHQRLYPSTPPSQSLRVALPLTPNEPHPSEMELAYSGLHQLCAPLLDHLGELPVPQRDALATVFGLSAGPAPDRFLVGLAALTLVAQAAEQQPLACIIDDAQWLDGASAQLLGFVARRLLAERVAVVGAARARIGDGALTGLPALPTGRDRLA